MSKVSALLNRYWQPLLCSNAVLAVATACSVLFSPRTWTSTTQFILPNSSTNLDANLGTLGQSKDQGVAFTNELNPLKIQASILTSNEVIRPIWSSDPERQKIQSLDSFKKLFKVKPSDQSTIISLEVSGSDAELAKRRAEQLVNSYQQRLNSLRRDAANSRQSFSQGQLTQAEIKLNEARNRLVNFQQSTGLVNGEVQTQQMVQSINTLTTTQAQVIAQGQAAASRTRELSQRLNLTPEQALGSLRLSQNKEYQSIRQKLSEVDTKIAETRGTFTDASPDIQSLFAERTELQAALGKQLAAVVPDAAGIDVTFGGNTYKDSSADLIMQLLQAEGDSQALQRQSESLQDNVNQLSSALSNTSVQQGQLLDLQREYEIAEGVYKGIVAQLEQARITAFDAYPNMQILDQPSVDLKPTSPKNSLIVLGGLLASIFGSAALVSFLESRNTLVKPKDIQAMEAPVLVRIPHLKQAERVLIRNGATEIEFQRLASAVSLMQLSNRRLLVTSSAAGEGKTTIAMGLATALAELGFRVLLVDGDFHKAELSRRLGHSLPERSEALPVAVRISPRLDLLPAASGSSNVAEFVAQGRFEKYLSEVQARSHYDYVVVDSAPVGATSEAALMAKSISNVLLVIRLGISDRPMVQETLEQLDRHAAQVIGLAVNGEDQRIEGHVYSKSAQVNS